MEHDNNLRIDKWLWAVRIFKTRSQAAEACKKGRIIVDDIQVKPSRTVKVGEVVFVKRPPVTYQYKILGLLS
ncbi:MAG: RNA-binding S4 domain-containing protein, partial [Bacteroidales bacterium]